MYRFFYLPALAGVFEESYVDFRRISCVDPALIDQDQKLASLTEWGRKQLLMAFFMYVTRATPEGLEALISQRQQPE